ncbi:hypothetical protein Moror_10157 [Moniliophthora roreri MCA 2997]|uniref:Uncharacterized protein n=1 Tax=Moniliophthora roreri (strain MCA 2997) TaxID=1381753 RepID=V2WV07_MONRO|nr:hypothetical protein Moror_10157 [Moniliophthora roreri MCA 2997]
MPTSTQVPQHTIADSLQLPVPNMTVFPLAMGQHEFDFFHLFNTDNLQVDSLSNLARFTEVPWDKFDANCSSDLESLLDSFSHHQNCAAYILQITCVALAQYGKPFQVAIQNAIRSRVIYKLLKPLNTLTLDQLFGLQMIITNHIICELPVDYIACRYRLGHKFGIQYPREPWGDWIPDENDSNED